MRFDLHIHTTRYSLCSHASPEEMAQGAQKQGLDGIVITEHGKIWGVEEHAELQAKFPDLVILRGVEVRSAFGDDFLIYGDLDPSAFQQGMEAKELFRNAEALGCAVVLAHPYRYSPQVDPEVFSQRLAAVECLSFHIRGYMAKQTALLREKLGLPCFASSDAHNTKVVGVYGLEFFDSISSERELVESLQKRRFRPFAVRQRIEELSEQWHRDLPEVRKLIAEGMDHGEIHAKYPHFNLGMLKALAEGENVELLYQV